MILVSAIALGEAPPGCVRVEEQGDVIDALADAGSDTLLVVSHDQDDRPARIAGRVLAPPRVAVVIVDGTATQRALIVRGLALLEPSSYGAAQAVADALGERCRTRLALSSVARLSRANPSIWQHLRSFLPRASFDVDLSEGSVRSVSPITWDTGGAPDACWASGAELAPLTVSLTASTAPLALPADDSPYGARHWAELTVIGDLRSLVPQILASLPMAPCAACGRAVPPTGCPFCGTAAASTRPAAPPAPLSPTAVPQFERQMP